MSMPRCFALLLALLVLSVPHRAAAQSDSSQPLSEILVRLINSDVTLAEPGPGFPSHATHFIPGPNQQNAPFFFNQAIVSQLSAYPLGSSSGGFSYRFEPSLGTFERTTQTFGPAFAERAVTNGRGKLNFGLNYQRYTYDTFEGRELRDGEIKFYLRHEDTPGANFFEGDVIETALRLELSTDTVALFANYGVLDNLDVGIAVPIVHANLDASVDATVVRLATSAQPGIHRFPGENISSTFSESGSATGIGDILLRAKYNFFPRQGGGVALGIDLRLPTGDEAELLGTGAPQFKFNFIGSNPFGPVSPHFNIGYTFSGESDNAFIGEIPDEFGYALGLEYAPAPRLTLVGDLLGRTLRDFKLEEQSTLFDRVNDVIVPNPLTITEFTPVSGNLNLVFGVISAKFNPIGNLLISASLLFPLTDAGLRDKVTPAIGFDYVF